MRHHAQYLGYVLRHKWFVLRAGLRTGAPLWRLVVHDWPKFTPTEWGPYARHFYARESSDPREFERALVHHINGCEHHWQHWTFLNHRGQLQVVPMPEPVVREMIADWLGAGRAKTGSWDMSAWWEANRHTITLHKETRALVEALLELHA